MYEKGPDMKKITNFTDAFVKDGESVRWGVHHIWLHDIVQSLKQKTRARWAQGKETEFSIDDEMDIANITVK